MIEADVIGIHIAGGVARDGRFIIAAHDGVEVGGIVQSFNLHGDSDLCQVGLDHFGGTAVGIGAGQAGEGGVFRINARFLQILLGLFHIIVLGVLFAVSGEGRGSLAQSHNALTVTGYGDHGLPVHCGADRLAEPGILKGPGFTVHGHEVHTGAFVFLYSDGLVFLQAGDIGGLYFHDEVHFAGLEGNGAGRAFGNDPPGDGLHGGLMLGIKEVGVFLKGQIIAPVPLHKAIGAGAHRVFVKVVALVDEFAGQNINAGHVVEHHGIGAVGGDLHMSVVYHLDVGPEGSVILGGGVGLGVFHGGLYILGVQSAAIMEGNALLQSKDPFGIAHGLIAFGQVSHRLQCLRGNGHQGIKSEQVHICGGNRLVIKRVQGGRLAFGGNHQGAPLFRRGGIPIVFHAAADSRAFCSAIVLGTGGKYAAHQRSRQNQRHHFSRFLLHRTFASFCLNFPVYRVLTS